MHTDNFIERISLQFHAFMEVIYWFFMEPVDNSSAKVFYSIPFGAQFAEFYDSRVHKACSNRDEAAAAVAVANRKWW